jgi:hypothetical protein
VKRYALYSVLIVSGDEALLAQIGLGVWAMCFFLASIFVKAAEIASKIATARSRTHEDSS